MRLWTPPTDLEADMAVVAPATRASLERDVSFATLSGEKIESLELGGMVEAVKQGFPQREIADASFALQQEIDSGQRIVVGVNAYTEGDHGATAILRIDPALERRQVDRLRAVKADRNTESVETALTDLKAVASGGRNLMPLLVEAARVHTSEGEIVHALQQVWGDYRERPVF
jgi:methylmalonyl-CoA mutase N-terminal domain/subunit